MAIATGFFFGFGMDRNKATRQLERIIGTIESGVMPWPIRELHVFGSYARGALNPRDLDLVVVHEPLTEALLDQIIAEAQALNPHLFKDQVYPVTRFQNQVRALMRKPGEKMDILVGDSFKDALSGVQPDKCILIWAATDPDWRAKIAAITPDPEAGRHPRNHFANIRRFHADRTRMELATSAIDCGLLKLTRIPLDAVNLDDLNPEYRHWLAHWINCRVMGKESMKLLPYGMWWMQQQPGQTRNPPHPPTHDCEMISRDWQYRVLLGKPSLWPILSWDQRTKVVCLIPHMKRDEPNEMFVFERGPRYTEERMEEHLDPNLARRRRPLATEKPEAP